mmetsp:Transcript_18705/g.27519  ORF Transcript_18705/g.27519 Transcript_18705/m.27519 type:complete len:161 (+) Transcript_18705:1224-1706(+)
MPCPDIRTCFACGSRSAIERKRARTRARRLISTFQTVIATSRISGMPSLYKLSAKSTFQSFLTLLKGADHDNACFTMSALPQPRNVPCESPFDFSDFQEGTTTNTNLLVEMTTTFLHNLIKNGENSAAALAVCIAMKRTTQKKEKKFSPRFLFFLAPAVT